MNCPKCAKTLRQTSYEGVAVDTCDSCGGEWLDRDEIVRINKARDVVFSDQDKAAVAGADKVVVKEVAQPQRALVCPRCKVSMKTLNYAYDSGIMIDKCPKCDGIWMDDKELEAVQIVIESWEKRDGAIRSKFKSVLQNIQTQTSVDMARNTGTGAKGALTKAIVYNLF